MTLACCFHHHRHIWPSQWPWKISSAPYRAGETEAQEPFEVWARAGARHFPISPVVFSWNLSASRVCFSFCFTPWLDGFHSHALNKREDQHLEQPRSLQGWPCPIVLCRVLAKETWKARKAFLGLSSVTLVTEKRQLIKPCSLDTLVPTYVSTQLEAQV